MSTKDLIPPRLAVGSHTYTRTYGCAMNVISWENGDTTISDMPSCTAEPLARMIQSVNDTYCQHLDQQPRHGGGRGTVSLLCAPCSVEVLDLAHRTVGTTGTPEQTRRWGWLWAEQLLIGEHGVLRHVSRQDGIRYVHEAAAVMRRYAAGETTRIEPTSYFDLYATTLGSPEREALRLAGMGYQFVTDFEEAGLARYVNPSFGLTYLGVRAAARDAWSSSGPGQPSMMRQDARIVIDAWLTVMQSETATAEAEEITPEVPELVVA